MTFCDITQPPPKHKEEIPQYLQSQDWSCNCGGEIVGMITLPFQTVLIRACRGAMESPPSRCDLIPENGTV